MTKKLSTLKINAMNSIVTGSCRIRKNARELKNKVDNALSTGNEFLTKNKNLTEFPDKVLTAGTFITGEEFVFSNIEHLYNGTLKRIFEQVPVKRTRTSEITPYHKAMIVRALVRGYPVEKIKKFYSQYSLMQLKAVEQAIKSGKIIVKI
jgi:hypothetical protein